MRFKPLTGFRDFYPAEMVIRRGIEAAWHRAAQNAGFEEFDGPVLESFELFAAKSGEEIAGQLYTFTDKGDRQVAMRPEMTPTLARMVGARANGLPKPIKWYCVPQFFRYERPQRGRGREFYQWNVDVIGSADPASDAEVISVAVDALKALGLTADDIVVRLNDRRFLSRMLKTLDVDEATEPEVLASIDKLERDPAAVKKLEERLGSKRAEKILSWCERFPIDEADELKPVLEACEDFGLGAFVEADFRIVRGLAYYTGPVWEIFDRARSLRAIAGGGRYDELIKSLGGPDLPAIGFGMGDVVLTELLRDKGKLPEDPGRVDVFVIPVGDEMRGPARRVITQLRARSLRADGPNAAIKLGKALKLAAQSGATRAVIVGPDEWSNTQVKLRDLNSGDESVVNVEEIERS